MKSDIVIVGAGSIGLPLSYYLSKKGLKVVVLEKEASWGRGQNRAAIGGIRATHSDAAKIRIGQESLDIVPRLETEHGFHVEWKRGGYLFVAYDETRENAFRELLSVQKAAGLGIDWIDPDRVAGLVPGIRREDLRGGTWSPGDGSASPLLVASAFYKLAIDAGVEFRFGETVGEFDREGRRATRARTGKDVYEAGLFINAAGADAARIAELLGESLPVNPDSHEAGVTEPVERFLGPMVVDIRPDSESGNYYYYQIASGQIVFCITPKPQAWGTDARSTSSFLPLVARRMVELHPRLANVKVRRTWRGLYPMTPDGLPVVGYARGTENVLAAAGMCGQGFMLGPGLGKILAEATVNGPGAYGFIFDELSPYRTFEGMELLK
ncbi:MAG: FAD-binding oxidoreductase [Spirochaetales bacterium]|nr:FAD-binding oxidoreductase [Spirochaetales bacterium]